MLVENVRAVLRARGIYPLSRARTRIPSMDGNGSGLWIWSNARCAGGNALCTGGVAVVYAAPRVERGEERVLP